jgi:uncharacterized protein YqjF (DUF2071 family)
MASTFLSAAWRQLIMLNYAVPEELLRPHVPAGTELDLYEGKSYVSVVGFLFDDVRLKGWRVPFHTQFEEVNLRFYVRHVDDAGVSQRGVVFLQELVPRLAVSLIANTVYGEHYRTVPMRHAFTVSSAGELEVEYGWRWRGAWQRLRVVAAPKREAIATGSVEEFITEHYWGYTKRGGETSGYEVAHPRWEVYPVRSFTAEMDFRAMYGEEFAPLQDREPDSVLLAAGSEVTVLSGGRVRLA